MENTVAVMTPKGGVGKTTTTINLAAAMKDETLDVLLVDNDWQGSATVHAGIKEPDEIHNGLAEVMLGHASMQEAVISTPWFDLLPGNENLANADLHLLSLGVDGVYMMRDALKTEAHRDAILIDCEPGLSIRLIAALAASRYVLAPISADYLSLKTLRRMLRVVRNAEARYSMPEHRIGVIITRFDPRQNQCREVSTIVEDLAGTSGFDYFGIFPERAAHRQAAAAGRPVTGDLKPIYKELARRVIEW